jgi:fused signal recognition particle receptor
MGFFKNLFQKKAKTYKTNFKSGAMSLLSVSEAFSIHRHLHKDVLDALETSLLSADVGILTCEYMMKHVIDKNKKQPIESFEGLLDVISELIDHMIPTKALDMTKPVVLLMVGVNGVGKTTTIGKLAHIYRAHNPLIIAADTFRAAAIDQLEAWALKNDVTCFKSLSKDPSSVIYDGMQYGLKHEHRLIIIDTAGRLQAKDALMAELSKMYRVLSKFESSYHLETLLVLDATTGQNGLSQAIGFKEASRVSGVVVTKLDGSAKGGIVLSVSHQLNIPMVYMGMGEALDDLIPFDKEAYILSMMNQERLLWN